MITTSGIVSFKRNNNSKLKCIQTLNSNIDHTTTTNNNTNNNHNHNHNDDSYNICNANDKYGMCVYIYIYTQ